MSQDGPFNKNETVEVVNDPAKRVGRVQGMENGKYIVLFEDKSTLLLPESALKRTQILFG
jgi:hypothetical protein